MLLWNKYVQINLLVIQDVPPKKKEGWFNTVGLEAYNE